MADFFFKGYFFQAVETYACPILDIIIIYWLRRVAISYEKKGKG